MTFGGRRVLLFGGWTGNPPTPAFHDTWDWDGRGWSLRQDMGPAERINHALAFDSFRGRVVLFRGTNASGALGDTWELVELASSDS